MVRQPQYPRGRGWASAISVPVILLSVLGASPLMAQPAPDIDRMAREILSDTRYQTELPIDGADAPSTSFGMGTAPGSGSMGGGQAKPPSVSQSDREVPKSESESGNQIPAPPTLPSGLGEVGRLLMWLLALVGFALLGLFLFGEIRRYLDRRHLDQGRQDWVSSTAMDRSVAPGTGSERHPESLDAVEQLAQEGRYGDAIHMLLLLCVEDLARRHGVALSPATTGREIVDSFPLGGGGRSALARLVRATELDVFGGRPSAASDYRTCLEIYRQLAAPPRSAPP